MSFHTILIVGRLGRDPEMRYTPIWAGRDQFQHRRQPAVHRRQRPAGQGDYVVPNFCLWKDG